MSTVKSGILRERPHPEERKDFRMIKLRKIYYKYIFNYQETPKDMK